MDTNVPPYQTLLIADALIKANKDFDLLMLPNQNHGYGSASAYMMRRRWDYFVKWLMGVEPPKEYPMQAQPKPFTPPPPAPPTKADLLRGGYGPYRANNDLLFYHLDVRVDPAKKFIGGKNTIRFKMLKDDTRIQLDLTETLTVDKILYGSKELKYERDSGAVFVDFPETLEAGHGPLDRLLLLGQPEGDRPLRRHRVPKGPGRPALDQHRVPGHRRQHLVAEQGPAVATRSRACD